MATEPAATPAAPPTEDFTELLKQARDQFQLVVEAESQLRTDQLDDKRFMASDQWLEYAKTERIRDKRPFLTVNRLPQFKRQITNQARQNRPSIQINPVDDFGDPETAEVLQGIVRHIEARSHAEVAYDTAMNDQVDIGRGWIRLITEWEDTRSFNQTFKILRVPDAFKVYMDPNAIEAPFDAWFAFQVEDLDPATFKRKYKKAQAVSLEDFSALGDQEKFWIPNGAIRVADYFYVELKECVWVLLSDGQVLTAEEADPLLTAAKVAHAPKILQYGNAAGEPELTELDRKDGHNRIVHLVKMSGAEVLERSVFPSDWIPLIPVIGEEIHLNGRVDYRGMTRDAKDQQRLYNYQVTSLVETIADAPKAPWVIADGQVEPYKTYWKNANTKKFAYLPYKPVSSGGHLVPAPQRQNFEPAIQAIVMAIQQADNDLKATTGFFDASMGERGPEQSGKAILARQKQGETGSANYIDNLGRALWSIGTILVNAIPRVFDAPRIMRIIGQDDQPMRVMVHAGQKNAVPQALPQGVKQVFDLGTGRYDVTISTQVAPGTRRQEAVEMLTMAIQGAPELMNVIGDLYFGFMDWPGARAIAERLKKILPPQVQDDPNGEDVPPAAKAKMAALETQLQEIGMLLAEAQEELRTKAIETSAKKEIAYMQAQIDLLQTIVKVHADKSKQDAQIEANDRSEQRQIVAGAASEDRQRQAQVEDRNVERQGHVADTVLTAELERLKAAQEQEQQTQLRQEQRSDAREDRSFQADQTQVQLDARLKEAKLRASAKPKPGAKGKK
jgi:hypothetical protein